MSAALPTVSELICAQNETHSSQMKMHGDVPRWPHAPSIRLRTSCCDLPQNEQDNCSGAAVEGTRQAVSADAASNVAASNVAESVFQPAKPNCFPTISRHLLCESKTLAAARESRRAFAIALASL